MSNKVLSYIIEVKDRATAQVSNFSARIRSIIGTSAESGSALSALGGVIGRLGGWFMAAQVAAHALGMAFRGIAAAIRETVAYEKDVYRLARAMGSVSEARAAMGGLAKSGAARDFGREEVSRSATKLQNAGAGSLINPEAMDLLAAAAKKADTSLLQVTESITDVWGALASGNDSAFKSAVRSMADMGVLTPVAATELIRLRDAGASAGEIFSALYGHLENNKAAMDALGDGPDAVAKNIAALKTEIAGNIGRMFKDLGDAWDWIYTKILEGLRYLTEKPHRLLLLVPGMQHIIQAVDWIDEKLEKWRGQGDETPAKGDVKTTAAGELDKQSAATETAKKEEADAKDVEAAQRELEQAKRRFFENTATLDQKIRDAEKRADAANQRSIDPKLSQPERLRAEAEAIGAEEELIRLREQKQRQIEAQNKEEERIAADLARANDEDQQRKQREAEKVSDAKRRNDERVAQKQFDRMSDDQKAAYLAKQMAAAKAAYAAQTDPLKKEQIRSRILDLAERGEKVAESRRAARVRIADDERKARESLADKARDAREGLARMGMAQAAGGDMSISQRFDWMGAVSKGQSPDEQIAANTEEMKKYLKAIADAEGVT